MQEYKVIYRQAITSDIIDLFGLVQEYCTEELVNYDNKSIKSYLDFQLGKLPAIVAVDNDTVVGVISFAILPSPFKADELIAKKIACFVTQEYRDQKIGSELLSKAEQICKEQGVKKFYFSGKDQVPGYEVFETEYVKVL